MAEINDATILAALREQMTGAVAKQGVAAGNLANLNTPGYRAQEVEFADTLDRQMTTRAVLARTDQGHLPGVGAAAPPTQEVQGLQARRDGNTVQLDRELLMMAKAGGEFAAAQTVLAAKFRLVRYALSEGR